MLGFNCSRIQCYWGLAQGDVMLRALRFMDSMIQRDSMQKAAFLNDLTTFWHKFDDRLLRLKVLMLLCRHKTHSGCSLTHLGYNVTAQRQLSLMTTTIQHC